MTTRIEIYDILNGISGLSKSELLFNVDNIIEIFKNLIDQRIKRMCEMDIYSYNNGGVNHYKYTIQILELLKDDLK